MKIKQFVRKKITMGLVLFGCLMGNGIVSYAGELDPNELIQEYQDVLGNILEDADESTIEEAFSFLKEKIAEDGLDTEEEIKNAIEEGKEEFGIEIEDQYIEDLLGLMNQLEDMGFDSEEIINDAEEMYQEYGADMVDHVQELVTDTVKDSIGTIIKNVVAEFFRMLGESIKNFFTNLF